MSERHLGEQPLKFVACLPFISPEICKPSQLRLPLLQEQHPFPAIRHDTIHKVKGESIDAVLVLGSPKFWNSVVSAVSTGKSHEDRRIAYVAMSRAKDLLVLSLPSTHFKKHIEQWTSWGFDRF